MVKLCNNELFEKGSFMKGNVFDYFEDLSKHNLKERNGVIKVDGVKLRRFVGEFPVIINLVSKDIKKAHCTLSKQTNRCFSMFFIKSWRVFCRF